MTESKRVACARILSVNLVLEMRKFPNIRKTNPFS